METKDGAPEHCSPAPEVPHTLFVGTGALFVLFVLLGWYYKTSWGGGGSPYKYALLQLFIGALLGSTLTLIPHLHEACHKYAFRGLGYENPESYNWNVVVPFGGPPHAVATGQHISKKDWPIIELAPFVVEVLVLAGVVLVIEVLFIPIVDPFLANDWSSLYHPQGAYAFAIVMEMTSSWGDIYHTYYFHREYGTDATVYLTDTTIDKIHIPRLGWEINVPFGKELHGFNHYYCPAQATD
jgi:hypothetical protein